MEKEPSFSDSSLLQVVNLLSDLVVFKKNDFHDFLKKLIKIVITIIPVDSCFIYFYDRDNKKLILIGSKKQHDEDIGNITLSEGEGITGWTALHKETVVLEKEAYRDSRFKFFSQLPEDKYEGFLSVPIMNEYGVIGVINLQSKKPYKFTKTQIKAVESIVKIIASAFAKILLERKVDFLQNKLEERQLVEKAKGVVMKVKNMSEDEAYKFIRNEAMVKRRSMKEISEAILLLWK